MKPKLLLFALALLSTMSWSQSVPRAFEDWKTTAGTQNFYFKNVLKTDGTDSYVAGATMNGSGNLDVLVAKYNSGGHLVWIQQYNGPANSTDFAADIYISSSYVYVTGAVCNNTTTPESDILYMKLNKSTGSVVFNNSFNGAAGSVDVGKSITVDATNSYLFITGSSYNSSSNSDIVTLKYDPSGTLQYTKIYNYSANLDDAGFFMKPQSSNRMDVIGAVQSSASGYKVATLSYSVSTGATIATSIGTVVTTTSLNTVQDFTNDGAGNYLLAGGQDVSGQGSNIYIQKFGSTSLLSLWTYTFNSASNADDIANAIKVDASNNVYIAGSITNTVSGTGKDIKLIKLNSSGVVQWSVTSTFTGDDEIKDMTVDASNNFYLTGYRQTTTFGSSDKNYYTVKYNSSGSKIWEVETDNVGYDDMATNIALDSLNNVIVTGQSKNGDGTITYLTVKYVQQDITNPVDLLGQPTNRNFGYHQNRGQIRNDTGGVASGVLYYTHNQNPQIYLEKNAYNYVFQRVDTSSTTLDTLERIRVSFTGSSSTARPYNYNPKTYPLNYFLGHVGNPVVNVMGHDRVVTQNIYPNIDLHYYSNSNGFKYYFVVKPSAKPDDIVLNFNGMTSTSIVSNNLFIDGVKDDVTLKRPYAYMVNGAGVTTTLSAASWSNTTGSNYKITVPTYTTSQTLIIVIETVNPASTTANTPDIDYSTYYGKTNNDIFNDIRVAANGDRYVVGNTDGGSFPITTGPSYTYKALRDAVMLMYSVTKDSLVFATFYGGNGDEFGNSIDIDSQNEIYIAGQTFSSGSTGIPIQTVNTADNQASNGMSINPSGASPGDGFIARFAPNGNGMTWSRYYGGSQDDGINSIYIDNSDNLFFTGLARSNDISMVNAAQSSLSTGNATTNTDAIVGKLNHLNKIVYSTYLGSGYSPFLATKDEGRDITVDGSGNAIVVGTTDASAFPVGNTTGNSNTFYDGTFGGARDGFIVRYSPTGTKQFGSYFGGADTYGIDEITRVNYNATKDEIYFAGQSNDTVSFPYVALSGAFNLKRKSTNAAFLASMTGNLTKQWCSSYGKAASNFSVTGLSSDNAGIVYLSGQAKSNTLNYPATAPLYTVYNDTIRNADDGFVAIFNPQKDLFHAHYLGGTGNDYINNAYVGANNKLYVVGNTGSGDYPISHNSVNIAFIDSTFGGGIGQNDGFITRFDMSSIQVISVKETSQDDYMLNVYPNPSTSGFILEMRNDELKNVQAKVYNITGQLIVEQKITQTLTKFYCESWANGVYLININANGKLKTIKLIKN